MPISVKEAAVYFALAESARQAGKEVAIRFEENGKITAIGVGDERSPNDARSAIINVLQNAKYGNFIATSYPADTDEKSLGMCIMQRIKAVYFLNTGNNTIQKLENITDQNPPWDGATYTKVSGEKEVSLPELGTKSPSDWLQEITTRPPVAEKDSSTIGSRAFRMYDQFNKSTRLSHYTAFPDLTLPADLPSPGAREDTPLRHEIFNKLAWAIVGEAATQRGENKKYPKGHNIGSVLRGPKDEILAWGINTGSGSRNSTLHGEVNLMLNYRKHSIDGAEIGANLADKDKPIVYSTLEPCHMCAGIIATGGNHMSCYYSQPDKGIKFNALQRKYNQSKQDAIDKIPDMPKSANLMGVLGGFFYLGGEVALKQTKSKKTKPAVTPLLNEKVHRFILMAIQEYFELVPKLGSPKRDDWDVSPEKKIWDAGLKLLHHINPGVKEKWKAYKPGYVKGIIPD